MTVRQAISVAGGLTERGSDRRIKIIRKVDDKEVEIDAQMSDLGPAERHHPRPAATDLASRLGGAPNSCTWSSNRDSRQPTTGAISGAIAS